MSVQAMTWVLDRVRGFKPAERLVLLSIANHADPHGKNAWPSIKTIADEADMSVASVYRALDSLAGTGILLVTKHAGGSAGLRDAWRPNLYELNYGITTPPEGHRNHGGVEKHKEGCLCRVCDPSQSASTSTPVASCESEGSQVAMTLVASCVVEPSVDTSVKPSTTRVQVLPIGNLQPAVARRNEIWDALEQVCGKATTRNEQARRGKVVKDLKDVGATGDEICRRAVTYRLMWPGASLTDTALVNHWSKCAADAPQRVESVDVKNARIIANLQAQQARGGF